MGDSKEELQTAIARSAKAVTRKMVFVVVDLMGANPIIFGMEKFCLLRRSAARRQNGKVGTTY